MARIARAAAAADGLYAFLLEREEDKVRHFAHRGGGGYPLHRLEAFRAGRPVEFSAWRLPHWVKPPALDRPAHYGVVVTVFPDDTMVSREETAAEFLEFDGRPSG